MCLSANDGEFDWTSLQRISPIGPYLPGFSVHLFNRHRWWALYFSLSQTRNGQFTLLANMIQLESVNECCRSWPFMNESSDIQEIKVILDWRIFWHCFRCQAQISVFVCPITSTQVWTVLSCVGNLNQACFVQKVRPCLFSIRAKIHAPTSIRSQSTTMLVRRLLSKLTTFLEWI